MGYWNPAGGDDPSYSRDVLIMPTRNVYQTARGSQTLGERVSPMGNVIPMNRQSGAPSGAAPNASTFPGGNPLLGGVAIAVLLGLLMFLAHRSGSAEDFKDIRGSAYNALVIGLAAALILPALKFLTVKVPIPGVSAWVQAA